MDILETISGLKEWEYRDYLIISLVFIFHAVLDVFYILRDTRPPAWDQSVHLTLSLVYSQLISAGRLLETISVSGFYPPLYHVSTTPLYYIFGSSIDVAMCTNLIYLVILLLSVYGIGKTMFSRETGLLAAVVVSFYPFLIHYQRDYMLEFPLIAMVALSTYFLLKSNEFKDRKYSALFGVAFALTMLTKWTAVFFLIGPVLWVFYRAYMASKNTCAYCGKDADIRYGVRWFCSERHKDKLLRGWKPLLLTSGVKNFLLAAFIVFLFAGAWYIPNLKEVYNTLAFYGAAKMSQPGAVESDPTILSLQSITYYLRAANKHVSSFFLALLAIGLGFLFKSDKKDYTDKKVFFTLTILIPLLIFTFIKNKDMRYTLPLVPLFAVISSAWIAKIKDNKTKGGIIALLLIVGLLQTSTMTFGVPALGHTDLYPAPEPPVEEDWKVEEALNVISATRPKTPGQRVTVVVLPDHPRVNGRTYQYYTALRGEPYQVYNGAYIPFNILRQNLPQIDYIIYKDGGKIGSYGGVVPKMYNAFDTVKDNFEPVGTFPLPDGSSLIVYKNKRL